MRRILLFALAGVLVILSGCAGQVNRLTEREIERRAPKILGPAADYQADVRGVSRRNVDFAEVSGTDVKVKPGLVIDRLTLTMRGIRYQDEPFRILGARECTFTMALSERRISDYLTFRGADGDGDVHDIRIRFREHEAELTSMVNGNNRQVPVSTTGQVQADGTMRLSYRARTLYVEHPDVPPNVQQIMVRAVNPLVDLSGLNFTPTIERVRVDKGKILVEGTATIDKLP